MFFIAPKPAVGKKEKDPEGRRASSIPWMLVLLALLGFGLYLMAEGGQHKSDPVIWRDGVPELSPKRKAKLEKELEELDHAEQYALKALMPGNYPCYSCMDSDSIFLMTGEIWKYGVTQKGRQGRYPNGLPSANLLYVPEYLGDLAECLKQEKLKIYHYVLLPENLKRATPLIRPPGNKMDR